MKKVSLDTWIQLLGMVGLLGGLVFVGLELQQSQRIAVATQIQGRNQMMPNYLLAPLEGQLTAVSLRAPRPHEELSENELLIREQLVLHRSLTITNAWQQYSLGLLTDDAWNVPAERARACTTTARRGSGLLQTSHHRLLNMQKVIGLRYSAN